MEEVESLTSVADLLRWFNGLSSETGKIRSLTACPLRRQFRARTPDDAIKDQRTEVILCPILIEMGHDDSESTSAVGALDTPGDGLAPRLVGRL